MHIRTVPNQYKKYIKILLNNETVKHAMIRKMRVLLIENKLLINLRNLFNSDVENLMNFLALSYFNECRFTM